MRCGNKNAQQELGAGASQIAHCHCNANANANANAVDAARQRLHDAIIALNLSHHAGISLYAAADAYAKAMQHEVRL